MTSASHVVLGAGQVGTEIARQLAAAGELVTVATRTGRDLGIEGVGSATVDATDPASVRAATDGAATVYFAVQPALGNWPKGFPPLYEGVIAGLAGTGRRLVVADNLYMYGPTGGKPIVETLPYAATGQKGRTRAAMATRLLDADRAGAVQVAIGRGSTFFGPGAADSAVGERFFGPIVQGKSIDVFGDPDLPHSFTYVPDFACALIELGRQDEAFGRAWHVPTAPAVSTRHFAEIAAAAAGQPLKTRKLGKTMLRLAGVFVLGARETIEVLYQFEEPHVLDDSAFRVAFGLEPTPLEVSVPATVAWFRAA